MITANRPPSRASILRSKIDALWGLFAVAASREPKMDRVRPAMLIAALVVDVGRRLQDRRAAFVALSRSLG